MVRRIFYVLIVSLLFTFTVVQAQNTNCDQALTLLEQAQTSFTGGDLGTGQALVSGAEALFQACDSANSESQSQAATILAQVAQASDAVTANALLSGAIALLDSNDIPGTTMQAPDAPAGESILYVAPPSEVGAQSIYLNSIDGTNEVLLTNNPTGSSIRYFHPQWSPDGSQIAFIERDENGGLYNLSVMDSNGANVRVLAPTSDSKFSWSPDGTRIAHVDTGDSITILDLATGETSSVFVGLYPYAVSWITDQNALVYWGFLGANAAIFVVDLETQAIQQLTSEDATYAEYYSDVSPNGQQIVFVSSREDTEGLYVMDIDGSNAHMIAEGCWAFPTWSPDSSSVIAQYRSECVMHTGSVWAVDVTTGETREVAALGNYPSWQPMPGSASSLSTTDTTVEFESSIVETTTYTASNGLYTFEYPSSWLIPEEVGAMTWTGSNAALVYRFNGGDVAALLTLGESNAPLTDEDVVISLQFVRVDEGNTVTSPLHNLDFIIDNNAVITRQSESQPIYLDDIPAASASINVQGEMTQLVVVNLSPVDFAIIQVFTTEEGFSVGMELLANLVSSMTVGGEPIGDLQPLIQMQLELAGS
jgi:TolB protein